MSTYLPEKTLLRSNGYPLAREDQEIARLVPSDPELPMEKLRAQYQERGYLWLKGILNREAVLDFRRRYFERWSASGLLAEGSKPVEGIYSGKPLSAEWSRQMQMEAERWPEYEAFCRSPEILQFYEAFLGGEVHLLKRKIIRYGVPGNTSCTPGHYDLIYLRAGSDTVCSSWIPLGGVPVEMGGLVYLEGSDTLGRKLEAEFTRKNATLPPEERISAYNKNMTAGGWVGKNLTVLADMNRGRWLIADYEVGDMVVHSPYMVHAATENFDPRKRLRLSTDIRYQLVGERIDPRWNNHHTHDDNL